MLLRWCFCNSPLPENAVYEMALILIALCWMRTWGCRDLNLLLTACALFVPADVLSEWHTPVWATGFLFAARCPRPLLGTTIVQLSPKAAETFEPAGSKAACSSILEAEVLPRAAAVGQIMRQHRRRTENTPEVWGLFPGATVTC